MHRMIALLFLLAFQQMLLSSDLLPLFERLVVKNTPIHLKDHPHAYNPSLIKTDQGLLLFLDTLPINRRVGYPILELFF